MEVKGGEEGGDPRILTAIQLLMGNVPKSGGDLGQFLVKILRDLVMLRFEGMLFNIDQIDEHNKTAFSFSSNATRITFIY